ncbi:MAG: ATP-binding protein [Myxococcota bacterium]
MHSLYFRMACSLLLASLAPLLLVGAVTQAERRSSLWTEHRFVEATEPDPARRNPNFDLVAPSEPDPAVDPPGEQDTDHAETSGRSAELTTLLGWAGAFAFVLSFGLAWGVTRGLIRPLRELELAAERVAAGDLSSPLTSRRPDEVGRAVSAFHRMIGTLRSTRERLLRAERIAAWRDIARRIAHEVKNPLSPIQVSIETMRKTHAKRHPDFEEIFEESTLTILEEVERLRRIVSEFSRFARLPRPRVRAVDVGDVLTHVCGLLQTDQVSIELMLGTVESVQADREQVIQVFVNLVQNAIAAASARHGSRGAEVCIELEAFPTGVLARIRDNGPGIPFDQRSKVFEPYFTTKAGGTGLGLAVVHRIVEEHGGSIEVDESDSGGAELRIFLRREGPPKELLATRTDSPLSIVDRDISS